MRKSLVLILILFFTLPLFAADEQGSSQGGITSSLSRSEIKLGQTIIQSTRLQGLENVKVLWQDAEPSEFQADILHQKDFYEDGELVLEVEFSFFVPGRFDDFYLTIPIVTGEGELLYLETKKYDINVINPLSAEEEEEIKRLDVSAEYELKAEKPQAKIKFFISGYLFLISGVLLFIFVAMIIFFALYKRFLKMKSESEQVFEDTLTPYERFVYLLGRVEIDRPDSERSYIEEQLSQLTEILKKLICDEFRFNAPFETTRELFKHLRQRDFSNDIVMDIYNLFNEIDMIKFAKADFTREQLIYFHSSIRELGGRINSYYQELKVRDEAAAQVAEVNDEVNL